MKNVIIITGPSGSGKTEIGKRILKNNNQIKRVTTCTTRPKRIGEKEGKDYFFLTRKEFINNIKKHLMLEYAKVYGNYYGCRKKDVEKILNSGKNVLFILDVQGALSLKKKLKKSLTIFIQVENLKELKRRLIGRATDSKEVIKRRLIMAKKESKMAKKFDKTIINYRGKINSTVKNILDYIKQKS